MSKQQKKAPNPGANRQQRREHERSHRTASSAKPTWLRVLIITVLAIMMIGFVVLPLLK